MSWPPSAMVLSFARGRARHVARELIDLEFRLDLEELTSSGAIRLLRFERDQLRRELERRMHILSELALWLDPSDVLRVAIERVCTTHRARGAPGQRSRDHSPARSAEIEWALALRHLERAIAKRADRRSATRAR